LYFFVWPLTEVNGNVVNGNVISKIFANFSWHQIHLMLIFFLPLPSSSDDGDGKKAEEWL
jgi:hypothetical protein